MSGRQSTQPTSAPPTDARRRGRVTRPRPRRKALLAILVLAALAPSGAIAQARSGQLAAPARKAPLTRCATTKVTVTATGQLVVKGWCRAGRKPVKATPVIVKIIGQDADGYTCQVSTKGRVNKFALEPAGMAAATVTVRYVPVGKHRRFVSRPKAFVFGHLAGASPDLQCGTPDMVSHSGLCNPASWPSQGWAGWKLHCGPPPAGACVAANVAFTRGSVTGAVNAPHIVCPSNNCAYVRGDGNPNDSGPIDDGMGGAFLVWHLKCPDGSGADVVLQLRAKRSSDGYLCPWTGSGSRTANIPLSREGTLYLLVHVITWGKYGVFGTAIAGWDATGSMPLTPVGTPTEPC